jgi:hypothetical protein
VKPPVWLESQNEKVHRILPGSTIQRHNSSRKQAGINVPYRWYLLTSFGLFEICTAGSSHAEFGCTAGVYQLQVVLTSTLKSSPRWILEAEHTFDKRNAHAPPALEAAQRTTHKISSAPQGHMGNASPCGKAWDEYRGKQRCPTCGVPSLICRDRWQPDGKASWIDRFVVNSVEQDIRSKHDPAPSEQGADWCLRSADRSNRVC